MFDLLIVGTISNVEKTLKKDLLKVINAFSRFKNIGIYLVESDSTDKTLEILSKLSERLPNLDYVSKGALKPVIKNRIERIRHCRNTYVQYIREFPKDFLPNYVVVADLDGMNSALNKKAVDSCFENNDWGVITANQTFGYYDIYALRHPTWQNGDCFEELRTIKQDINTNPKFKFKLFDQIRLIYLFDKARKQAIFSKMIRVKTNKPSIKVDSAFGGLAIYKVDFFLNFNYDTDQAEIEESEHVALHKKIINKGGSIYINPKLVNSRINTHNINRFFIIRQLRQIIQKRNHFRNAGFKG
jgi:glycosyltransferase involved in cell wall biosynthesis